MKITNPNMMKIASGQTDHPDAAVRVYREQWEKQGYELPEWKPSGKVSGSSKGCGGCAKRKAAMNRVIPGSGDLLESVLTAIGFKQNE